MAECRSCVHEYKREILSNFLEEISNMKIWKQSLKKFVCVWNKKAENVELLVMWLLWEKTCL